MIHGSGGDTPAVSFDISGITGTISDSAAAIMTDAAPMIDTTV
jgi:hypothetical protein